MKNLMVFAMLFLVVSFVFVSEAAEVQEVQVQERGVGNGTDREQQPHFICHLLIIYFRVLLCACGVWCVRCCAYVCACTDVPPNCPGGSFGKCKQGCRDNNNEAACIANCRRKC